MTPTESPSQLVGTTRWRKDTDGTWSTVSGATTWTLQFRHEATPPLTTGWTVFRTPRHLTLQEPLHPEANLVRALRWATGYVVADALRRPQSRNGS